MATCGKAPEKLRGLGSAANAGVEAAGWATRRRRRPPDSYGTVPAGRHERVTVLREREGPHPAGVSVEHRDFLVNVRVPETNRVIHVTAGERAAVGREGQRVRGRVAGNESSQGAESTGIPQKHRTTFVGLGNQVAVRGEGHSV